MGNVDRGFIIQEFLILPVKETFGSAGWLARREISFMSDQITTYGIIGFPLGHTLSPVMHNTAFRELKADAIYQAMPLKEEELDAFFEELRDPDCPIFGLNVTVPYKEKVLEYLDVLNPLAEKIGAVNTIVIDQKRTLIGYNTDAPGFLSHLQELKVETKGSRVAILGAGGSCRAILSTMAMVPERPEIIRVFNRTPERTRDLVGDLSQRFDTSIVLPVDNLEELEIEHSDLLINTTSVGLKASDPSLVPEDILHPDVFVYDLIYNPWETRLLRDARLAGARTSNGLGMLYYQGVLALQHWAEMEIPEPVKKKMRKALEEQAR